jgi:hypothetical protein
MNIENNKSSLLKKAKLLNKLNNLIYYRFYD